MADLIEGRWDCPHCSTRGILGRHRTCTHCMRPRGKVRFYFGSAAEIAAAPAITDPNILETASAGPDWYCAVCGGGSPADTERCMHCDAAQTLTQKAPRPHVVVTPDKAYWSHAHFVPRRQRIRNGLIGLGLVVLLQIILWVVWGYQEHDVEGDVTGLHWTHTTYRDHWTQVVRSDWRMHLSASAPRMPVKGQGGYGGVQNIRNCREEIHHYETYACGTHTVCENKSRSVSCGTEQSCSVVDHGNGYGSRECTTVTKYCSESYRECREETKYCERPIYETRCDYDTWVWKEVEAMVASGDGPKVWWVKLEAGALDRIRHEGLYEVHLAYTDRGEHLTHVHTSSSLADYLDWNKGLPHAIITVNNFGGVSAVRQKRPAD